MNILGIDLGSVYTTAIIAQKDGDKKIKIIGYGIAKSQGMRKGSISSIDLASNAIAEAIDNAYSMSGVKYDKVVISISGADAKSEESTGVVHINSPEVGPAEIYRAIASAKQLANPHQGHEIIHILPYNFKVDDHSMDDPLGMSGMRLEVLVHIIQVETIYLSNLKKAMKLIGLEVDNIVLSGYASAIACLDDSERELGAVLIDMGGAVCDMVAHLGGSIRYNSCLQVGSTNITYDLSMALHTTISAAEKLKLNFADFNSNDVVSTPAIGDDTRTRETSIETVAHVMYARTKETFIILGNLLSASKYDDEIGAGIVLTGGMTKLAGFQDLANSVFGRYSVRIANAKKHIRDGGYKEIFENPENSCAIGLCLYAAGMYTPYEFDSNNEMRFAGEEEKKSKQPVEEDTQQQFLELVQEEEEYDQDLHTEEEIKQKPGIFKKVWDKLTNQF